MDRLLFVDDEPFVLRALKRTFELEGFEVVTAQRPADALDLLQKDAGFVVIGSDYRMPDMNGAEFLHGRASFPRTATACSSPRSRSSRGRRLDQPGRDLSVRPKPWDRDDLLAIVAEQWTTTTCGATTRR